MRLIDVVSVSASVAATRSRLKKRALLSECLRAAPAQVLPIVVDYLSGTLPQGRIGLGPATLRKLSPGEANEPSLSVAQVDAAFTEVAGLAGPGSQAARRERLGELFARCTADEQRFLVRLVLGELRQGALESVLVEAIAEASGVELAAVRRAVMLSGEAAGVAAAAMDEGADALARYRLEAMKAVRPMLAQPAESIAEAMDSLGEAVLEDKLDGARVQVHRRNGEVRVFTRALNDVTVSVPEVVELAGALPGGDLILDGEVIALRENGKPLPFQVTMRRFGRKVDVGEMRDKIPLSVFFFDALMHDGEALIDRPAAERFALMADALPETAIVRRRVSDDAAVAQAFLSEALAAGHEGIMAKSPSSLYEAGSRGAQWLKIKQAHTLDLVVLAAEWGSGRRKGWLSNLHLGARDEQSGEFVMLGKTFKGLTDKTLTWQTEQLLARETERDDYTVHVKPELVVEIAVNEIQSSPQYPAGMALRFARVKRYRHDKTPAEADTLAAVRTIFAAQGGAG